MSSNNNKKSLKEVPVKWVKLRGKPQPGYKGQGLYWSFDAYLSKAQVAELKSEGLGKKIKEDKDGNKYIQFKRKAKEVEIKDPKTGETTKTWNYVPVYDHRNEKWDNRLIGNGSVMNVNFMLNTRPSGDMANDVLEVQVWDYVEYQRPSSFSAKDDTDQSDAEAKPTEESWTGEDD